MLFMSCVCHDFTSVHCCLVVSCCERADLLALVCDVKWCFCHFPMCHMEYMIVSVPDLCCLSLNFIFAAYDISSPKVTYTYYTLNFCFLFMKSSMGGCLMEKWK